MVRIFIVYGGKEGEEIGRKLEVYFKGNNIGAFLASPQSPEIEPNEDFQQRISHELKNANLAIIVVTEGIHSSSPALGEIDRILDDLKYPSIPFVKNGVQPPARLQGKWKVSFDNNNPSEPELKELELKMWRFYDHWKSTQVQQQKESGEVIPQEIYGLKG